MPEDFFKKIDKDFLETARTKGWQVSIYESLEKTEDYIRFGDERGADWINLIPLNKNNLALVLGSDFGHSALSLSEACKEVYIGDSNVNKLAFLEIRKEQQRRKNISLVKLDNSNLPIKDEFFDLVFTRKSSQETLQESWRVLKKGGYIFLSVENLFSPQNFLSLSFSSNSHSIFGYRNILENSGFSNIRFYGILPSDRIPLFYVPLWDSRVLKYFFENIFLLSEMVSPEAEKGYVLQYKLAKIGVKFMSTLNILFLMKLFFPHFWIIGEKNVT